MKLNKKNLLIVGLLLFPSSYIFDYFGLLVLPPFIMGILAGIIFPVVELEN